MRRGFYVRLVVWDVGGQDFIRPLWNHYFSGSQAVIFVVDSQDDERMELGKETPFSIVLVASHKVNIFDFSPQGASEDPQR